MSVRHVFTSNIDVIFGLSHQHGHCVTAVKAVFDLAWILGDDDIRAPHEMDDRRQRRAYVELANRLADRLRLLLVKRSSKPQA
jgi:hypothetical protein